MQRAEVKGTPRPAVPGRPADAMDPGIHRSTRLHPADGIRLSSGKPGMKPGIHRGIRRLTRDEPPIPSHRPGESRPGEGWALLLGGFPNAPSKGPDLALAGSPASARQVDPVPEHAVRLAI